MYQSSKTGNEKPYYSLNQYLQKEFGEKVYRLSLNGGFTCPNRDGKLDTRGCIFCSKGGSGDFAASVSLSVEEQIKEAKEKISKKTNCKKYIAYFQAYTNTYGSLEYLNTLFTKAISHPEIVALSIATRPDCLPEEVLDLLSRLNEIKPVWIELGLQTIHDNTRKFLRSGFSLSVFADCVAKLKKRNLAVIVHVILGLPGETKEDLLETICYLSHLGIQGIKLQLLHILTDTDLYHYYLAHPFPLLTLEEYCHLVVECIRHLPPEVVIHRITGDAPKKLLAAPSWSSNKKVVLNQIHKTFRMHQAYQGEKFRKEEFYGGSLDTI